MRREISTSTTSPRGRWWGSSPSAAPAPPGPTTRPARWPTSCAGPPSGRSRRASCRRRATSTRTWGRSSSAAIARRGRQEIGEELLPSVRREGLLVGLEGAGGRGQHVGGGRGFAAGEEGLRPVAPVLGHVEVVAEAGGVRARVGVEPEDESALAARIHRQIIDYGVARDLLQRATIAPGPAAVGAGEELQVRRGDLAPRLGPGPDLVAGDAPPGVDPAQVV